MRIYPVHKVSIPNGETIAYRKAGDHGPTLILLHGNMSSSVHFQNAMAKLEDDFIVYAPDLRGFGDSTYLKPFNSLGELAKDVEAFIDALKIDKFSLLGWSTGGGVAMEIAADLGDRVEKLFLLDSVGIKGYPMYKKDNQNQPILSERIMTKEEVAADKVQVLPILYAYQTNNRDLIKTVYNAVIYHENQPVDEDYELLLDAIMKQRCLVDTDYSLVVFNMTAENNGVIDGSNRLRFITSPVVIIHGMLDRSVPFQNALETKAYFGDQATLIPFEKAGHSVITDDLTGFIDALKEQIL